MSALLWHAEAAEHMAEAFKEQVKYAAHDVSVVAILTSIAGAYTLAAASMREQLRAQAQGEK